MSIKQPPPPLYFKFLVKNKHMIEIIPENFKTNKTI